jgi:hypothetical protein
MQARFAAAICIPSAARPFRHHHPRQELMENLLNIVTALVMLFVVGVLLLGFWNMLKGGSGNTSQRLMRLRVIGQAAALLLLLAALFFFGGNRG